MEGWKCVWCVQYERLMRRELLFDSDHLHKTCFQLTLNQDRNLFFTLCESSLLSCPRMTSCSRACWRRRYSPSIIWRSHSTISSASLGAATTVKRLISKKSRTPVCLGNDVLCLQCAPAKTRNFSPSVRQPNHLTSASSAVGAWTSALAGPRYTESRTSSKAPLSTNGSGEGFIRLSKCTLANVRPVGASH